MTKRRLSCKNSSIVLLGLFGALLALLLTVLQACWFGWLLPVPGGAHFDGTACFPASATPDSTAVGRGLSGLCRASGMGQWPTVSPDSKPAAGNIGSSLSGLRDLCAMARGWRYAFFYGLSINLFFE
jgi:hypothetical protein